MLLIVPVSCHYCSGSLLIDRVEYYGWNCAIAADWCPLIVFHCQIKIVRLDHSLLLHQLQGKNRKKKLFLRKLFEKGLYKSNVLQSWSRKLKKYIWKFFLFTKNVNSQVWNRKFSLVFGFLMQKALNWLKLTYRVFCIASTDCKMSFLSSNENSSP